MKWLSLKIYLLPLIMQEVDSVTEKYINTINEIRRTNDSLIKQEFDDLRESITNRIRQLETFYEENIHDIRITNFEKVRLRLKKLLMYDLEILGKIENTAEIVSSRKMSGSSNKVEKQNSVFNEKEYTTPAGEKKVASNRNSIPTANRKKSTEESPIKNKSIRLSTGGMKQNTSRENFTVYSKVDLFDAGMSKVASGEFKEINKWKELVFKIKLTDKEYELLLKEKSKSLGI